MKAETLCREVAKIKWYLRLLYIKHIILELLNE